jgi:hypothetical protein
MESEEKPMTEAIERLRESFSEARSDGQEQFYGLVTEQVFVNRRGPWSYSRRAAVRLSWRNYSTGVAQEIDTVPEAQAMGFLTECVNELQRLRKIRKLKVAA